MKGYTPVPVWREVNSGLAQYNYTLSEAHVPKLSVNCRTVRTQACSAGLLEGLCTAPAPTCPDMLSQTLYTAA